MSLNSFIHVKEEEKRNTEKKLNSGEADETVNVIFIKYISNNFAIFSKFQKRNVMK